MIEAKMNRKLTFGRVDLNTPFRGARKYIHSTSIYNELLYHGGKHFGKSVWVRQLKLSQFFDTQCYATTTVSDNDQVVGNFSMQCADDSIEGYIVTDSLVPISTRENFDEKSLCLKSTILDEGVESEWQKVPFIDQCVALTKYFHNHLYPLEGKKWVYTRLTLVDDITHLKPQKISIMLHKKLGNRMTQSHVLLDDKFYGTIEFSVN